jgi:hypothetical protein
MPLMMIRMKTDSRQKERRKEKEATDTIKTNKQVFLKHHTLNSTFIFARKKEEEETLAPLGILRRHEQ